MLIYPPKNTKNLFFNEKLKNKDEMISWPSCKLFISQSHNGKTFLASHKSQDQLPDVARGANHEEDDDRKQLEDDGAACFIRIYHVNKLYSHAILIACFI